jgi:hypothetical protein
MVVVTDFLVLQIAVLQGPFLGLTHRVGPSLTSNAASRNRAITCKQQARSAHFRRFTCLLICASLQDAASNWWPETDVWQDAERVINYKECGGKQIRNLKAIPKTCHKGLLKQPHACQNSRVSPTDTAKATLLTALNVCTTSSSNNRHSLTNSYITDNVTRTEPNRAGKSKWPQQTTLWQA